MFYLLCRPGIESVKTTPPVKLFALVLIVFTLLYLIGPFDAEQLYYVLVGAVAYYFLQTVGTATADLSPETAKASPPLGLPPPPQPRAGRRSKDVCGQEIPDRQGPPSRERQPRKTSLPINGSEMVLLQPQQPPAPSLSFCGVGLKAEVDELLQRLSPTPESESALRNLTSIVQQAIQPLVPEGEVVVLASGALVGSATKGFDVAEVDIVLTVCPHVLVSRLQGRLSKGGCVAMLDARKLQKSAVRACTDRLIAHGVGFKFRRSAFRGNEPKVTLLAPVQVGVHSQAVPADFSVNSVMPLHAAALMDECGRIDPRATPLILLVRRWAQNRLICQIVNGHLSPYAWSLLVVYFLQVGTEDGHLFPPIKGISSQRAQWVARKMGCNASEELGGVAASSGGETEEAGRHSHVSVLLKEFFRFYNAKFDWHAEAAAVRLGQRSTPEAGRSLHFLSDGTRGPYIEDPFDRSQDLADCMTSASFARLREELTRADSLLASECSLVDLLQLPTL